jgi:hypothetical protein
LKAFADKAGVGTKWALGVFLNDANAFISLDTAANPGTAPDNNVALIDATALAKRLEDRINQLNALVQQGRDLERRAGVTGSQQYRPPPSNVPPTLQERALGYLVDGANYIDSGTGTSFASQAVYGQGGTQYLNLLDQFFAGWSDVLTGGISTDIRSDLYGDVATQNHSGGVFFSGQILGLFHIIAIDLAGGGGVAAEGAAGARGLRGGGGQAPAGGNRPAAPVGGIRNGPVDGIRNAVPQEGVGPGRQGGGDKPAGGPGGNQPPAQVEGGGKNPPPPKRPAPPGDGGAGGDEPGGGGRGGEGPAPNNPGARNPQQLADLKAQLRAQMSKPVAKDPMLSAHLDELYREGAQVGSGSTADAIRHELATGKQVGGVWHSKKGEDSIKFLERWLKNNPTASPGDRAAAENVLLDLKNALGK